MSLLENKMLENYIIEQSKGINDKGGNPILSHFQSVVKLSLEIVDEYGLEKNISIKMLKLVALSHDFIELKIGDDITLSQLGLSSEEIYLIGLITRTEGESRKKYIKRCGSNIYTTIVKIADLKNNMDVSRLCQLGEQDFRRLEVYHSDYRKLVKKLKKLTGKPMLIKNSSLTDASGDKASVKYITHDQAMMYVKNVHYSVSLGYVKCLINTTNGFQIESHTSIRKPHPTATDENVIIETKKEAFNIALEDLIRRASFCKNN